MAIAIVDFIFKKRPKKYRVKYAYTYEMLAQMLGFEDGDIINIWNDPSREIVAFVIAPDEKTEENWVPEGQEMPERVPQCKEMYGDVKCDRPFGHHVNHRFKLQDGYHELGV